MERVKGYRCQECLKAAQAKYRSSHRELVNSKGKIRSKQWRLENPEKHKAGLTAWRAANPGHWKRYKDVYAAAHLRRKYGITMEQKQEWIEKQAGLCGICCNPMRPGRDTHVDHVHATGRIRGLLCTLCNKAIGIFRDSPMLLLSAADWVGHVQQ